MVCGILSGQAGVAAMLPPVSNCQLNLQPTVHKDRAEGNRIGALGSFSLTYHEFSYARAARRLFLR